MAEGRKSVLIVAGEASGDMHAANLVRWVKERTPEVDFTGIGGPRMAEAGVEILFDAAKLAVVGLVEVLRHFPTIYGALRMMRRRLAKERPDLLVLVDYPDFNLRLAKTAKRLGIKVLYYISPQIWAWRSERVHTIGKRVDMMAVVLPFEAPFYERAGVPVRFVGHPLRDEVHSHLSRDEALASLGLSPDGPTLGLLPGSRRSEVERLLPVMVEAAVRLKARLPRLQFILPLASTLTEADLAPYLKDAGHLEIQVTAGRPYDVMRACDTVISASGTATLETALIGTPLVVIYKVAPLTYRIMSRMIRVEHIALCNIVAGTRVAPELIQDEATPERIAAEAARLLEDPEWAAQARAGLAQVRDRLGSVDPSTIAQVTLELLGLGRK